MIDQVATAFECQDYSEVARLLKTLPPEDPWNQLYQGRLSEVLDKPAAAEAMYRHLLQTATGSKITAQARQGLKRLENLKQVQRQQAIVQATLDPSQAELGLLILETVPTQVKSGIAQKFAQIMQVDPYTARLQLPSRGWRLYRTGPVGELKLYTQPLWAAGIPVFWFPLTAIRQIPVLQICYFQSVDSRVTVICQDDQAETGSFTFHWSEVTQRVEGQLPIFEEVVDLDVRGKLQRKQRTQDHAQFCDLHLPSRNCILRIDDSNYQSQNGIKLGQELEKAAQIDCGTAWANWQNLMGLLSQHLSKTPVWSRFYLLCRNSSGSTRATRANPVLCSFVPQNRKQLGSSFPFVQLFSFFKELTC